MVDALLFSLSFYAWATAGTSILLYSMAFLSKKFGLISTLILSLIIYISAPFGGRTTFFAEQFGWITEEQREMVSIIWMLLLGIAGTLSVRYLTYRQTEEEIAGELKEIKRTVANRQIWRYIVGIFLVLSLMVFALRLINA